MAERYEIHVISNTHWDREWLFDFQETRMLLVEFFDGLLDILDSEPGYKSFLLDSQCVPVEDYLEVRPENGGRLARHVADGRLFIGPWYTDPECFSIGGESLVRNLVYGHRVARSFGRVMKAGYTPFSYGQNSQMPQIYQGFGIDTMLFYHGVSHDEVANEFIFEGADGSRVLGSQISSVARYNFYHHIYRRVMFDAGIDDRTYDWRTGGCPFHLCSEADAPKHHILLDPTRGPYLDKVGTWVRRLRAQEKKVATTNQLAFMMGHDSSIADAITLDIIKEAKKHLKGDRIFHSSLPDYLQKVKAAVPEDLTVLKGERRVPKPMPLLLHLYSDVLSSRTRMKRLNALAEMDLQRWTEPFTVLAWTLGAEYPQSLVDLAWKTLLRCHAHDSIAGSGVDDIEQDMIYHLRQVLNISAGLKQRSLQHVQARIDNSQAGPDDVLVTVVNPSPCMRSEVVTMVLDLPATKPMREFQLRDAVSGDLVPVQEVARHPHHAIVNHLGDAPAMMAVERVTVHAAVTDVPGMGYATYAVDESGAFARAGMVCGPNAMENEYLHAQINPDGTLDLTDRASGIRHEGLHYFEDGGEAGMTWMHLRPAYDEIVSSLGSPVNIRLVENGLLVTRYRVEYRMQIPAGLEENNGNPWQRLDGVGNSAYRSKETRELVIESVFTLRRESNALEVTTRFNNTADSHRLRVCFPTYKQTKHCHVESAFDVVEREIEFGPESIWFGSQGVTFPMQRFVDVSDGSTGLAVINDGLREYEVTQDPSHTIAITLMRAFEVSLSTVSKRWDRHPEMRLSQASGQHEFHYLLYPHSGLWNEGGVYDQVERFCAPLQPLQTGRHGGDLPQRHGFMALEGADVVLSAVKRSEDSEAVVVRIFNPTDQATMASLTFAMPIQAAARVTLEELPEEDLAVDGQSVSASIGAKKIATIRIVLA